MTGEKGFMLLDVIIGVLILSIGIGCLVDLAAGARNVLQLSQWRAKAANLAQSELEELKAMGLQEVLNTGKAVPGQSVAAEYPDGLSLRVSSNWVNPDLLQVKVSSTWAFGPNQGTVMLDTLLSRR